MKVLQLDLIVFFATLKKKPMQPCEKHPPHPRAAQFPFQLSTLSWRVTPSPFHPGSTRWTPGDRTGGDSDGTDHERNRSDTWNSSDEMPDGQRTRKHTGHKLPTTNEHPKGVMGLGVGAGGQGKRPPGEIVSTHTPSCATR
jgi:hypothetical protein